MNNDQIKSLLLQLRPCQTEFEVTMTGKKSSRVNGLYKPDSREILLFNKNFTNDNEMVYTAIHEYAHHLDSEAHGGHLSPRAHGPGFWALFHGLLEDAEGKGLYRNLFEEEDEFAALAEKIKGECLSENGKIMKRLGELMIEAEALCRKHGARFEDFIDRVLGMSRVTARTTMKLSAWNVNPDLGYDSMKIVAGIRDPGSRAEAEKELLAGKSQDAVKVALKKRLKDQDPKDLLFKEKERIEKTIRTLEARLHDVEDKLRTMEE